MGKLLSAATGGDVNDKRCSLFTKHQLDEEKHISEKKKMERNEHCHEASVKPTAAGGEEQKDPDHHPKPQLLSLRAIKS